jgi:poly(A) polymerase
VIGGENLADALRLSRADIVSISRIRDEIGSLKSAAALGWKLGPIEAQDVLLCRAALFEQPLPPAWQTDIARGAEAVFPVTAADLMPALSGAALGAKLREAEARWLASDLTLTKAQLLG